MRLGLVSIVAPANGYQHRCKVKMAATQHQAALGVRREDLRQHLADGKGFSPVLLGTVRAVPPAKLVVQCPQIDVTRGETLLTLGDLREFVRHALPDSQRLAVMELSA